MILEAHKDAQCDVFDANGRPLEYAVWCDTETGEAVHYVRDENGYVMAIGDDGKRAVKTEWRQHPAPLTFVRHNCATH